MLAESRSRKADFRFRKTCRGPRHSCNGVPGVQVLKKVDKDPPIWKGFRFEARFSVGIRVGRCAMYSGTMYSGTLIKDLIAAVERAERSAREKRTTEEMEPLGIFELQCPQQTERVFAGAA